VFENRVLRGICGPEREEVAGGWRRLHNEELHNLYASPSIIREIKSSGMRGVGHVARNGVMRNVYSTLVENLKGRDHSEDPGGDGKIMLEWILGLRIVTSGGLL
jgi:hypothetical protein